MIMMLVLVVLPLVPVVSEKAKDEFEMCKAHMFSSFSEYTELDDKDQVVPLNFVEFVKRNKSSLQARFPEVLL